MLARATREKQRAGPWSDVEIALIKRLSHDFKRGLLRNVPNGTSIRPWLAIQLRCHPMRISKKFHKETDLLGIHNYTFDEELVRSIPTAEKFVRDLELQELDDKFKAQVVLERAGKFRQRRRRRKAKPSTSTKIVKDEPTKSHEKPPVFAWHSHIDDMFHEFKAALALESVEHIPTTIDKEAAQCMTMDCSWTTNDDFVLAKSFPLLSIDAGDVTMIEDGNFVVFL
ncbi:hypothetical protein LEN26_007868 [Aphanomyces euteiches]|nr:hypothetical protein AeMF1_018956 [Aphanomyces euteiches]KAH9131163.1 hypothetical protein LEN26_007868 [Aphanomyces euteiches]KAH9190892.1 hypothetical protein AeNC1_007132 [Aphanomyces euteiches]